VAPVGLRSIAVTSDDGSVVASGVHMAKTKRAAVPDSVRRQLASLKHRVSWLEAALKPKKEKPPVDRVSANYLRKSAEQEARDDAMREYREQEKLARYREDPYLLEITRERERKENAFLRARGLKPNPSYIPKELRRRVRR
jgi:hypothetical protein